MDKLFERLFEFIYNTILGTIYFSSLTVVTIDLFKLSFASGWGIGDYITGGLGLFIVKEMIKELKK